jgi:hypothetical protein
LDGDAAAAVEPAPTFEALLNALPEARYVPLRALCGLEAARRVTVLR